jgi:cysteine desulfurase
VALPEIEREMNVYLDNAATTPVAKEVVEAMVPVLAETFGNPSSSHAFGRRAKVQVEQARRRIAKHLNCPPASIIFTSGGTEADNLALRSAVRDLGCTRIITSEAEHSAVVKTAESLAKSNGVQVQYVRHDGGGVVDLVYLEELLQQDAGKTFVSLMHANNEVAVVQDLQAIGALCQRYSALFHSDTVQTMCHYAFNLAELPVQFVTCAAHKFHGPKGVGFLYVSPDLKIGGQIEGGGQERSLRGGTENTAGIVGLAAAMDLACSDLAGHQTHVRALKARMVEGLRERFPDIRFNGNSDRTDHLYTVLNAQFPPHPKSGMALFLLDLEGVACSGGSACSSGATLGSHVLRALDFHDPKRASIRFSFSRYTTPAEIDAALAALEKVFA